ncbi:MAG: putative LigA [Gemmatimonadetes bacterium]|nr:putative LigA [Gemmatimonadota bacterium]
MIGNVVRDLLSRRQYGLFNLRIAQSSKHLLPGHLMSMFRQHSVDCVMDAGANRGQYGQMLRAYGYRGRIISIEPATAPFEQLARVAAADGNWDAHRLALGSTSGTAELNVSNSSDLSSLLTATSRAEHVGGDPTVRLVETVEIRTLDSLFDTLTTSLSSPRVFLKLDTQGFDLEALRGARASLPLILGMQSEVSIQPLYEGAPPYLEALAYYQSLGFSLTGLFNVIDDAATHHLIELDAVLFR